MFLDLLGELLRGEEGGMDGNGERERGREGGMDIEMEGGREG